MSTTQKKLLFYNAIPMPHSIMLHNVLVQNGYEVSFWYYKDLTKIYPWNTLNSENKYYVFGRNGNNLRKLVKSAWKSDLVIITGWHTKIHVILALMCYFKRIKYAYWLDVPEKPEPGLRTFFKMILLKMANYLLVTGREGIHRISSWNNIKNTKFRDFPYLSAVVNDNEIVAFNKMRIQNLKNGNKIKILISNRFEKRKGYGVVYEAIKKMRGEDVDNFSFTIIGSGAEFEYYKLRFKELRLHVDFKFWVEYKDYLKHIKETDILIHASLHEPFGIPPADAMSHGKLVIASDEVMSARDRVVNGKNGYLFKANNSVELGDILNHINKNRKLIYKLGNQAFHDAKKYQSSYNIDVVNEIIG